MKKIVRFQYLTFLGMLGMGHGPLAQPSHDDSTDTTLTVSPSTPPSMNTAQDLDTTPSVNQEARKIQAASLVIWSSLRGENIPASVLNAAGLTTKRYNTFNRSLKKSQRLNKAELTALKEPYSAANSDLRFSAREKILFMVERLQKSFPEFQSDIPEILTVWGEARGVTGFTAEDDRLQQAKMATIIHVLRNRSLKVNSLQNVKGGKIPLHKTKWQVATRRYQFSCFEPYDVNLSTTLGPNISPAPVKNIKLSFDDITKAMPEAEQRALQNLSIVIARLRANQIIIPKPLGDDDVRHYLTPTLMPFSKKSEKETKRTLTPRMLTLRLPNSSSPEFLAVVPSWAEQKNLISQPPVDVLDQENDQFHRVTIPTSAFVYFKGIL